MTVNGHGDVRSRNARDEINLADFENFDDDDDQDEGEEEAILASIRRRSNALSFSETPENGTLDARKTEQTTCEAVPYNEERKCPVSVCGRKFETCSSQSVMKDHLCLRMFVGRIFNFFFHNFN